MNIKQIGRTLTIALLASLMAGSAMAATISDLRGGVKDTRARLVMDIDETMHYEERAQGRTLTLTFDAKTDRTRSVRVRTGASKTRSWRHWEKEPSCRHLPGKCTGLQGLFP